MPDFLLEIGCEEIPARMLADAAAQFSAIIAKLAESLGLHVFTVESMHSFSTPRRLAVFIPGLLGKQPNNEESLLGPSVAVAYKNGGPTQALQAFAKKAGVGVSELEITETPKGSYVRARRLKQGRPAAELLAEALPSYIEYLHWPKNMYWRAGAPERFVRPIRWMVAMLDGEIIPLEFAGVNAGNVSRGHRLFSEGVRIASPGAYKKELEKAHVLADPREREQRIRKALDAETRKLSGVRWREDASLLDTVVNLTEWPSVILGSFDKSYLALPEEVLVTVMRDHQKYFAVEDAQAKLLPYFLAVLNTDGDPDGLIRHGNERVLRARFNDAQFFWQTDQKTPLKQRIELLKAVTFQKDLGSYHEKTVRVEKLAGKLAEDLGDTGVSVNLEALENAAWLCKTDLTTELVKEFTELQGIVGGLYARAQGLGEPVAQAIYDHYRPGSMDDVVPRTPEGAVLSIADKADSIAGMFALGLQPTGSKDPFALRRQANGIVRTIAEHKLRMDTKQLMLLALEGYHEHPKFKLKAAEFESAVAAFMRERVEFYLRDVLGFAYDIVSAVLAPGGMEMSDIIARAKSVSQIRESEDFQQIAVAFKRIKNILSQARQMQKEISHGIMFEYLQEEPERRLATLVTETRDVVEKMRQIRDYDKALSQVATLRPAVDVFFDKIMVMVDDSKLRAARLGLLAELLKNFSTIADFSEIVTERKS